MPARLNRRRYREIVATLKEVVADSKQSAARRLHAVDVLMEVYARHDRSEIAREVRNRASQDEPPLTAVPVEKPTAQEAARAFLASITKIEDIEENNVTA